MDNILLIHQDIIQHYRVSIYNYLHNYLKDYGYNVIITSDGFQKDNPYDINFPYFQTKLNFINLIRCIKNIKPKVIILFVNLRNYYLFPLLFYLKFKNIKVIYWGHGIDLNNKNSIIKNILYSIEHNFVDSIILYSDHLVKYINKKHYNKIFIANNTLNLTTYNNQVINKQEELLRYNIKTKKNIICVGRLQKRKRIHDLILATRYLNKSDVGLILVGDDDDNILQEFEIHDDNIYILGPLFGKSVINLLSSCDIYCLPGAIGLSIVDALYCGLPVITENVNHGPEIMYLKDGINGFYVNKGDYKELANKIDYLLTHDNIRNQFSEAAIHEIMTCGHINNLCNGFLNAINFIYK